MENNSKTDIKKKRKKTPLKKGVRIMNIKTLKAKKYDELDLGKYYNELFGMCESKTSFFFYGTSGSGKSVFTIQLAELICDTLKRKGLYVSHEESDKKSMKDRSVNFNINSDRLYVGVNVDFETLLILVRTRYYRLVIIDSVQYMQFTYDQQKTFNHEFVKRKITLILVSFGTAYKKPACSNDIMHACDVKVFFDKGAATIDSRYLSTIKKVRLFSPQQADIVQQKSLF